MFLFKRNATNKYTKQPRLFLYFLFLVYLLTACSRTPVQKQFVSGGGDVELPRSEGSCEQMILSGVRQESAGAETGVNPEKITLLNWNIYKGIKSGWLEDLQHFIHNIDIIILQEATNNVQLREFIQSQGLYWHFNSAFTYWGVETGLLTASLEQPVASCGLRTNEPIIGLPKTTLVSRYAIKGSLDTLLVANIHGINFAIGTEVYKKQLNSLQKLLQHHQGPIVVAGDFNNWSIEREAVVNQLVEDLSLTPLSFVDEGRTTFWGVPVDHIFYRGLEVIQHRSYQVTSSDHNPIEVTFRLVP